MELLYQEPMQSTGKEKFTVYVYCKTKLYDPTSPTNEEDWKSSDEEDTSEEKDEDSEEEESAVSEESGTKPVITAKANEKGN